MLRQKLLAHPRLVVKAAERTFRGDLHQVAVAFFVLRKHQQVVVRVTLGRRALDVVIILLANIEFTTDDGLNASFVCRIYEMHSAKDVAMIGHGYSRHAQLFDPMDELFHVTGAVEHGVIGVKVEVDELGHELCFDFTFAPF